ncbi:MAG: C39 family peptidase [Longibaculum sp.]
MKRKWIIGLIILLIPFMILFLDHLIFKEEIPLNAKAHQSSSWQKIVDHQNDYPPALLKLAMRNEEAIDFVAEYPQRNQNLSMSLEKDLKKGGIPLLLQWDKRWGYRYYGDEMLAINGCGPTCFSMVVSYLKQNPRYNPYFIAKYAYQNGYYQSAGTSWDFMTSAAQHFDIQATQLSLDENLIISELQQGHPIICSVSQGIFTTEGHFIVLREYKDGLIYVNDPNSRLKSQKGYRFDEIKTQIKNLWAYSL